MKKILFICLGNSCRSQMAEGFARHYGMIEVQSAGTKPAETVAPLAIEVMGERGIDIAGRKPKSLTAQMLEAADMVISMGCGVQESCPLPLGSDTLDWGLEDPYGHDIEKYREVRDEIERWVRDLID